MPIITWRILTLSPRRHGILPLLLRQYVFCEEPLSSWFACRPRKFCLLGSEYKKNFLDATFIGRSESESRELCAGASTSASSRLSANSSNEFWKISQTVVRRPIAIPLLIFVLGFWWITRRVSWSELVTSLWCWTWRCTWWCTWRVWRWRCGGWTRTRTWTTIQGQLDVRNYFFCINFSLFGRPWLFTVGPLVGISVFFAKFSKW